MTLGHFKYKLAAVCSYSVRSMHTNVCHDICVPKRSCPGGACEAYRVGLCTVGYILITTVTLFCSIIL